MRKILQKVFADAAKSILLLLYPAMRG